MVLSLRDGTWRVMLLVAVAACGGGSAGSRDGAGAGNGEVAAAPARDGEVWEADRAGDRSHAGATMVAFVNGVHVLLVDDDDAYAGMTRLRTSEEGEGARTIPLAGGLTASLVPVGEVMELRFSSGEVLPLRRQPERAGR